VPYSLAARRASRLARCGRGWSAAAAVGRRKVAGQCAVGRRSLCPHHQYYNPLGGAAFGRSGRSNVKTRARALLTRRSQSLAARSVQSRTVGGGCGGRVPVGHRAISSRSGAHANDDARACSSSTRAQIKALEYSTSTRMRVPERVEGGGCLELQSARALWKGVNGEGICARDITLNVEQATKESS